MFTSVPIINCYTSLKVLNCRPFCVLFMHEQGNLNSLSSHSGWRSGRRLYCLCLTVPSEKEVKYVFCYIKHSPESAIS